MANDMDAVRAIVARSLDWEEAHATFDASVANFPESLRADAGRPERLSDHDAAVA